MELSLIEKNKSKMLGAFVLCDERLKAKQGKKQFIFGPHQWERLMYWNGASMLDGSNEGDVQMILRLGHPEYVVRKKNQTMWMRKILRAIWNCEGDAFFADAGYGGPRILERTHHTISIYDLTMVIMAHRNALKEWTEATNRSVLVCTRVAAAAKQADAAQDVPIVPAEVTKVESVVEKLSNENCMDDWENGEW